MKLSDLRVGDIVQFRQGYISAVFINNKCDSNLCLYSNMGAFLSLDSFDENFKYCKRYNGKCLTSWDIIAVCKLSDHTIKRDDEIYDIIKKFLKGELTKTDIEKIPWDWREEKEMSKENENYIMLNGQKIEITVSEEKLRELGLIPEKKSPFERVEKGKRYWHINEAGHPAWFCDHYTTYEDDLFDAANYCTDKDIIMQRAMHEHLYRLLWRFSMENGADKIDWNNNRTDKWFIYYNNHNLCLDVYACSHGNRIGAIHFNSEEVAQRAIKEIIEPFIEKYPTFRW